MFLQEWNALASNRENITVKLPRVWKLRWHLLRHFSGDKVWKNQVMRFCSFFNSFVSMDAIKSNSNQHSCCFIFRLENDAHTHQISHYINSTKSLERKYGTQKRREIQFCSYFGHKLLCDFDESWILPSIETTLSFRVYDAPIMN